MRFSESAEYIKGDVSQRACAEWFRARGWYVVPSYDFTAGDTKAPRATGPAAAYVLPDIDVFRGGMRRWVEVKYKALPTYHRITGRIEHGINLRHYRHYLRVEEESGCELWLAVHEHLTGKLLARRMCELAPHLRKYDGKAMGPSGMAFFPRRELQHLATLRLPGGKQSWALVTEIVRRVGHQLKLTPAGLEGPLTAVEQRLLWENFDAALALMEDHSLLPTFGEPS